MLQSMGLKRVGLDLATELKLKVGKTLESYLSKDSASILLMLDQKDLLNEHLNFPSDVFNQRRLQVNNHLYGVGAGRGG